ncbi:gag-pol polyprotein [Tanacetum coccineum]
MSTQQDIYAAGSENRPPMLNKDNYVPWLSRLLRYAKSKPNGKLLVNAIKNGPYDLYEVDYTKLYDFLKFNQAEGDEIRAEQLAKTHDMLALMANSHNPYKYPPCMNMRQERQIQMVGGNGGNKFRRYAGQIAGNQNGYNVVQNVRNQNANQTRNGNVIAARAGVNGNRNNGNQMRCYNCRGLGHYARNCIVRPRRGDAAYLQTQLLIAQKEEAGIQLQAEEFDLMAAAGDIDEIEEVNANYILMANLQQASTSEEQYIELLKPITEPYQVLQNDNNVISVDSSMEHSEGTIEQHPATVEETRAYCESLYNNLVTERITI